jgi:dipeptidyl aminopeptidase/acylaminoacyl peptidase
MPPFVLDPETVARERSDSLYIYRPECGQPRPAILFVHGGPAPPGPTPRDWTVFTGYAAAGVERGVPLPSLTTVSGAGPA